MMGYFPETFNKEERCLLPALSLPFCSLLIGMAFVRLCLDLIGEVFSGVRPLFRILIGKSVELWGDSFIMERYC